MRVVLPYPVSTNRYWRMGKFGSLYATKEARAYKSDVRHVCFKSNVRILWDEPVEIHVWLYPKGKRVMDLDNCLKVTLDAFQGVAYRNDNQVKKIVAQTCQPDEGGARLEVEIMEFVDG